MSMNFYREDELTNVGDGNVTPNFENSPRRTNCGCYIFETGFEINKMHSPAAPVSVLTEFIILY